MEEKKEVADFGEVLRKCVLAGYEYKEAISDARSNIEKGNWHFGLRHLLKALELRGTISACGGWLEPLKHYDIDDLFEGIRTRDKERVLMVIDKMKIVL